MTSPAIRTKLLAAPDALDGSAIRELTERTAIGDATVPVDFLPLDGSAGRAGGAVHLTSERVLFAGPLVVHGPRAPLAGTDTALWAERAAPAGEARADARRSRRSARGAAPSCSSGSGGS